MILGSSHLASPASKKKAGTPAEEVGSDAAHQLLDDIQSGVCVDKEMQNQVSMLACFICNVPERNLLFFVFEIINLNKVLLDKINDDSSRPVFLMGFRLH